MPLPRCLATILALLVSTAAPAAPAATAPPPGAMAFWTFDPTAFRAAAAPRAERQTAIAAMRAAVSSGVISDARAAMALEGLLVAAEVGAVPHTLAVLDFAAHRPQNGSGMDVDRLQMVLELRTSEAHDDYLRTIRAVLVDGERARSAEVFDARQRAIELPDGSRAVAFADARWEPWAEVAWVSTRDAFTVGLGRGALERWFAPRSPDAPAWAGHVAAVDAARPAGRAVAGGWLDLAALRRAFPDAFTAGRARRLLQRLDLTRAGELMVHARLVPSDRSPPLLALDATTRAQSADLLERRPLSAHEWPDDALDQPPPRASAVLVAPIQPRAFLDLCLDLVVACTRDNDMDNIVTTLESWKESHADRIDRQCARLRPFLVIADDPPPVLPIPGAATLILELAEGADPAQLSEDLDALTAGFRDRIVESPGGVRAYRADPAGVIRMPAWGVVGSKGGPSAVVAGWGPPCVTETRARFGAGAP